MFKPGAEVPFSQKSFCLFLFLLITLFFSFVGNGFVSCAAHTLDNANKKKNQGWEGRIEHPQCHTPNQPRQQPTPTLSIILFIYLNMALWIVFANVQSLWAMPTKKVWLSYGAVRLPVSANHSRKVQPKFNQIDPVAIRSRAGARQMCEFGGKRADHKEHLFVSLCPFQKRRKYFKPRYTNLQTCLHSSFSRLHLFPGQNGHSANSSSAQHRLCSVFCVVAGASRVEWLFPHLSRNSTSCTIKRSSTSAGNSSDLSTFH